MAEKPEGFEGAGFFATSLDKVVGLARKNSIWPLPFAPWPRTMISVDLDLNE
jgi:NADH-quinone oxidoreductase subunit B